MDVEFIANREKRVADAIEALRKNVAKATQDSLKIPDLLEKQRQQHLIPTGAFSCCPVFDWCYLYQLGPSDAQELDARYGDTGIVMPDNVRDYKRDEACRGVLVAAGPSALDFLRTNGIDVGHTVRFCKFTPFRLLADMVDSKELWILAVRAESIAGSETLEAQRRSGEAEIVWDHTSSMHRVDSPIPGGVSLPKNPFSNVNQDVT
jgi:hypothetical protein